MTKLKALWMSAALLVGAMAIVGCSSSHKHQPPAAEAGTSAEATESLREPGGIIVEAAEVSATVKAVDRENRTVTLADAEGETATYKVNEAVRNFDQIKVGDTVRARVVEAMSVFVRKGGEPGISGSGVVALAPKGAAPGVIMADTTEVVARIDAVDMALGKLTVTGPLGRQRVLRVSPDVDLSGVGVGDDVVIRYTEALAVMVDNGAGGSDPATAAGAAAAGVAAAAQAPPPTAAEVRAIAEEAFDYALPLVMNYAINYSFWIDTTSSQYKVPMNKIHSEARVFTYRDTAVVTPNSDTPYSFACFDLRAQPWVLSIPPIEKNRYYSVQFTDWNTFNVGYAGSRTTGNDGGEVLLVGPDWTGPTPPGIKKVITSTTQFCLVIYRTQLFHPGDMPNVVKIQAGYKATPLNEYLQQPAPPAASAVAWPKINAELAKLNLFEYLDFILEFAPPGPEEKEIRAKLARIGVGPGKSFALKSLSPEHRAAVIEGMKAGEAGLAKKVAAIGENVNGWRIGSAFGNRAFFNGNWLLRAAAAKAGIYGNDAEEAMYPMTRWLADGEKLDGSKNRYTLTFPPGMLPPVNAFWSVTMYDGKTQLLIKNPIGRYLINSPMLPEMKKNPDGSLTIYVQKDSPGPDKASNWLPAPDGPMYMVMRLYWPKAEPPSILPPGKGTWQPPGIAKVK